MDDSATRLLHRLLKEAGYSVTNARQYVGDLLWQQEPQSMHDLTERLEGRIDRASLYRTIALFERLGIVQRVYMGWKYKVELSDVFSHHHHHLSCVRCGKVIAIREDTQVEELIRALAARDNFAPQSHQLEIQGLCQACVR